MMRTRLHVEEVFLIVLRESRVTSAGDTTTSGLQDTPSNFNRRGSGTIFVDHFPTRAAEFSPRNSLP